MSREALSDYLAQKGEPVPHYERSAIYCRCGQLLDDPGDPWCVRCDKLLENAAQERAREMEEEEDGTHNT